MDLSVVVNTPKIMYKKNWVILMKIEGLDTISAEVFIFFLLRIYSDFAPNFALILLRFVPISLKFLEVIETT